jgi:hypothetical protein
MTWSSRGPCSGSHPVAAGLPSLLGEFGKGDLGAGHGLLQPSSTGGIESARVVRTSRRARGGNASPRRKLASFIDECVAAIPVEARANYQLWIRIDSAGFSKSVVDQGRLIAEAAAGFVARTPALASAVTVDSYKITARSGSVLEIMAADAASTYGLKPSLVICDEFCQWPGTTNARGVWTAVLTAMGKVPGAKLLCTSTSGDPGHWSHKIYQTALKSKSWTVQDTLGGC